jgi:ATP-dependent Lon protease
MSSRGDIKQKANKRSEKKEKEKAPKRGGPKDQDDSSDVDEFGNVKGLINYDYDSSESEPTQKRKPRKAALKAKEKIRSKMVKERKSSKKSEKSASSDSTWKPKRRTRGRGRKVESESESDSEDDEDFEDEDEDEDEDFEDEVTDSEIDEDDEEEEEDEEEDEEDEEEEEEEEDEEERQSRGGFPGISILFGEDMERNIPRRHNMKKESPDVRKFVKLMTKPVEEDTIDEQIDQFKALGKEKQAAMLEALERRSEYVKKEQPLMFRLLQMKLTPETMALVMSRYNALNTMDPSTGEYYKLRGWMEKLVSIPLGIYKEMPVRIEDGAEACGPFMSKARKCLDEAVYGQEDAKLQIQQFIASKIANPSSSGLSLLLVGPPGIGKTECIKNGIAKALGWPFQFISLGGDSDATTYTGHQFVYEGSHSGKIANCLANAKSMSMVLMFDELDKISNTPKGEEIQNLLVHLTDPVQNMEFEDKYLSGIPLDMSKSMFVFSANDINKIDRILLDRMVVVNLSGYEKKDKMAIAEQFLLPQALKEVGLTEKVLVTEEVLKYILDTYASEEPGVRELKRCLGQIAQRINMLRMFNVKELPFHIPGFKLPFTLKKEHVDLFLKKKEMKEKVPFGMYA